MFAEPALSEHEQSWHCEAPEFIKTTTVFLYPAIVIVLLSVTALAINHFYYHYTGSLYLPDGFLLAGNLFFIYGGFFILQGRDGKITRIVREIIYFILVMMLIILATNAAQYTPFPAIDQHILRWESLLDMDTSALITWAHANPSLKTALGVVYGSLDYQLCYIPLIVILAGRKDLIREFYFLLITTVLIGFTFYYFFPTTAPASVINGDYFTESQRATYVKYFQIHHYIQPTTMEGGLIALPSFHVIWAYLCLFLVRGWPIVFLALLPINIILMASCVLLGWHYCIDILGSVVVIVLAHFLYGCFRSKGRGNRVLGW